MAISVIPSAGLANTQTLTTLQLTNALGTAYGGTALSSFTSGGLLYASSTSALATGSALTFDGTNFGVGGAVNLIGSGITTIQATGSGTTNSGGFRMRNSDGTKDAAFYIDSIGFHLSSVTSTPLIFDYGNSEQMRLTSTGLGIGTSSPAVKLDVQGALGAIKVTSTTGTNQAQIQLTNTGGSAYFGIDNSAGSNFGAGAYGRALYSDQNYPWVFFINGSEQMRLTSTGLGIGTNSPSYKLDVNGTANISGNTTLSGGTANGVAYLNGSKVLTTGSALTFDGTTLTSSSNISAGNYSRVTNGTVDMRMELAPGLGYVGTVTNHPVVFEVNNSEQMRLTSTGLGIGTSSPSNKLSVYAGGIVANFGAYGTSSYDDLEIQAYSGYCAVGTRGSTPLLFNIARSEKMRLDSSGNLLVGTTTATGKASIAGAITATASSALVNPSVGVFGLYTSGAIPNTYLQMPSGGSIDFWKPDTSVAARIDSSGNFLIGTTNAPSNIGLGTKFNTSNGIQYGNSQRSVIANPGTKTFTITGGSNGGATYFSIEANQYNGYVSAYFYCINASGNWTVNQVTRTTSGTAPTITITNNNSATVTVAVNVNSSYSGGFITIDMSLNYISVA